MNDSFARAQAEYDNATPREPEFVGETRVLRAVVYLTYNPFGAMSEDEMIDAVQTPFDAEKDITRVLSDPRRMAYPPDEVEVVDAEYMSVEESRA